MNDQAARARTRVAGEALLHPLTLGALALWILNDHVGKPLLANWLTGKLSDAAGLLVCPLLALSLVELSVPRLSLRAYRVVLWSAAAATGGLMVAIKLLEPAAWAYRAGLGLAQWPVRALFSQLFHGTWPHIAPVQLVMDATDLLMLPSLVGAVYVGLRAAPRTEDTSVRAEPAAQDQGTSARTHA